MLPSLFLILSAILFILAECLDEKAFDALGALALWGAVAAVVWPYTPQLAALVPVASDMGKGVVGLVFLGCLVCLLPFGGR